jgi:hypothetical protein
MHCRAVNKPTALGKPLQPTWRADRSPTLEHGFLVWKDLSIGTALSRPRASRYADTDKQEDLNLLPQAAMSDWNRRLGLSVAAVTGLIIVATRAAAFAP